MLAGKVCDTGGKFMEACADEEDLRRHTVATSQNGWVKVSNKSRRTRGTALDGEEWYDVRHGRLSITPAGTAK